MGDIRISRITVRGPNSFDVLIKIADFPREFLAGSIDLSYSRCEKLSFFLRFLFFDFNCHPKPDDSLSSGSFVFNPQEDNPFAASPLAQFFVNQRITCKLSRKGIGEEDDDNCVLAKYRLAVWAQAAANPLPIIDVEGDLDATIAVVGGAKATAGGGTPTDLQDEIVIEVCCVEASDLHSEAGETPPLSADGVETGEANEGVVKPLPQFASDSDCVVRCTVRSHPSQ